jgi:hypothetical protein
VGAVRIAVRGSLVKLLHNPGRTEP